MMIARIEAFGGGSVDEMLKSDRTLKTMMNCSNSMIDYLRRDLKGLKDEYSEEEEDL